LKIFLPWYHRATIDIWSGSFCKAAYFLSILSIFHYTNIRLVRNLLNDKNYSMTLMTSTNLFYLEMSGLLSTVLSNKLVPHWSRTINWNTFSEYKLCIISGKYSNLSFREWTSSPLKTTILGDLFRFYCWFWWQFSFLWFLLFIFSKVSISLLNENMDELKWILPLLAALSNIKNVSHPIETPTLPTMQ
jgi:hypothetical protein